MTKEIKITKENKDEINEYIESVQRRARARKADYIDCVRAIEEVEKKLDIPKKYMLDVVAGYDPGAQTFPGSYRGFPESTQLIIKRRKSGWYLTKAYRDRTHCMTEMFQIYNLPDETKAAIIRSKMNW